MYCHVLLWNSVVLSWLTFTATLLWTLRSTFMGRNVYGASRLWANRPWDEMSSDIAVYGRFAPTSMGRNVYGRFYWCGAKRHTWGELSAGRKVYEPTTRPDGPAVLDSNEQTAITRKLSQVWIRWKTRIVTSNVRNSYCVECSLTNENTNTSFYVIY